MRGVRSFTVWRVVGKRREFCVYGLHGFAWRYYGLGLTVKGFPGDVCRRLWFSCHIESDCRVLGPSTIFRGFRERILCVGVLMGLVDYFRFCCLFLGFTNVFNGLVILDSEWSA